MYCPLKFNPKNMDTDGFLEKDIASCEKANCQFWNTEVPEPNCTFIVIGTALNSIANSLAKP